MLGSKAPVVSVRRATQDDIPWLQTQLRAFADFNGSKLKLYRDDDTTKVRLIYMIDHQVVMIAEDQDANRMGFVAGLETPHFFNPDINTLSEMFWWVDEQYRGTRAGLELLNAFTTWGKENCDWITFVLEENSPVNDRCLTNRGYKLKERNYLMEVS